MYVRLFNLLQSNTLFWIIYWIHVGVRNIIHQNLSTYHLLHQDLFIKERFIGFIKEAIQGQKYDLLSDCIPTAIQYANMDFSAF